MLDSCDKNRVVHNITTGMDINSSPWCASCHPTESRIHTPPKRKQKRKPPMPKTTFTTATEMRIMRESQQYVHNNYRMAKALVEGKVDSDTLKWAEMIYASGKSMYEEPTTETIV